MKQLIDKDALVAEIERRRESNAKEKFFGRLVEDNYFLDFIDTLEVKGVDYDKEVTEFLNNFENANIGHRLSLRRCANHFFTLGVNASNPLTWKDIADILDVTDAIANDDSMEERLKTLSEEEYCQEVLKRFKTQKGE